MTGLLHWVTTRLILEDSLNLSGFAIAWVCYYAEQGSFGQQYLVAR